MPLHFGLILPSYGAALDREALAGAAVAAEESGFDSGQVQFWQSNKKGQYTRALSATVLTDRAGRFRYRSPVPTSYEGLAPHIHIHIRVIGRGQASAPARSVSGANGVGAHDGVVRPEVCDLR
jgi:hypothetical protein